MDSELLILGSAHRHGVPDEDIQHALRDIVATYDVGEGMTMVIGPDRTGVLIEVGVVESYDALCAVHAMRPVRERFFSKEMTVPRSLDDILARSEQLADQFEAYQPRPEDRDTISPVTAVRLAALRRDAAERDLADAVAAARRDGGTSWKLIGELVGTSGEAARQRYGKHAAR